MNAETVEWSVTVILTILGLWIIVLNYLMIITSCVHRRHHSLLPLLGGVLASVAMWVCPLKISVFAWMPLVVDPGCLLSLIGFLYAIFVNKAFKK
ncbi:MAG: hypothetical protein JWQ71_3088 [Pedosphaera sp.]|nr:hypothetical protein [Pedosphaera sp.]